jgi:ankyrin repeat protein
MPKAYIALGHGYEVLTPRREQAVVPPGCTLVLAEECGMTAVLPAHIYKSISTSSYEEYFQNPVAHKETLERIFRRPLRIYTEGQRMPSLSIIFLSSFPDNDTHIEPSGLMPIPIAESTLVKDTAAISNARYYTPKKQAYMAYDGAVYPDDVKELNFSAIRKLADIYVTQLEMFNEYPGVHFNLLCRTIEKEEDELKRLVISAAPQINPCYAADLFGTVDDWLSTEAAERANPTAIGRMHELVDPIMERRRSSGEPLGPVAFNRVVNLILAKHTPATILERAISALSPAELNETERRDGYTLLGVAASVGNSEAIHILLAKGANINERDVGGSTALMIALQKERPDIASALLDAGADIRIRDDDEWTALMYACTSENTVPLIPRLATDTIINHADDGGDTALNIAAGYPFPEAIGLLLKAGANINTKNKTGDTPLMTACASAHGEDAENLREYAHVAEILIQAKAKLNIRNITGHSALAYAYRAGLDRIGKMLIEEGARAKSWAVMRDAARKNGMPLTAAAAVSALAEGRSENTGVKASAAGGSANTTS